MNGEGYDSVEGRDPFADPASRSGVTNGSHRLPYSYNEMTRLVNGPHSAICGLNGSFIMNFTKDALGPF